MSIYCDECKCAYNHMGECMLNHAASAGVCEFPGCIYFLERKS